MAEASWHVHKICCLNEKSSKGKGKPESQEYESDQMISLKRKECTIPGKDYLFIYIFIYNVTKRAEQISSHGLLTFSWP